MNYLPRKYFAGLSKTKKLQRKREIKKYGTLKSSDPKAYVGFKTDVGVKTKTSQYTRKWRKVFPEARSLSQKSKASGVPLQFIKKSYDRGLAAWRTGHRPGASQQAWGYARAHSFLMCGKTYYGPDSDLVNAAKKTSKKARKWFTRCK